MTRHVTGRGALPFSGFLALFGLQAIRAAYEPCHPVSEGPCLAHPPITYGHPGHARHTRDLLEGLLRLLLTFLEKIRFSRDAGSILPSFQGQDPLKRPKSTEPSTGPKLHYRLRPRSNCQLIYNIYIYICVHIYICIYIYIYISLYINRVRTN